MSEQKYKNSVKLIKETEASSALKNEDKRIISFDLYFQSLMKREPRILAHHKAPMRKYAEGKKVLEATQEEFDELFKFY